MKELLVLTTLLGTVNSSVNQEVTTTTISTVDLTEMNIYEIQEAVDDGYLTYEQIMKQGQNETFVTCTADLPGVSLCTIDKKLAYFRRFFRNV